MTSRTDDIELMGEAACGTAAAQRKVVSRLLPRVERLCHALLRRREDAQDATQLSMLEILKSAASFRGESSLERWADRLTVRTALRSARAERRAQRTPLEPEHPSFADGAGEASVLAKQYLDRLSEPQRITLLLRHGLEFSIDEIAELVGISPNTVKDRLLRGRGAIRQMIRREQSQLDVVAPAPER